MPKRAKPYHYFCLAATKANNKAISYWQDWKRRTRHDQTVIELLREDPGFADDYLTAALDEVDEPGSLIIGFAPHCRSQGMVVIAERAGIKRESLYRALSPKSNPTVKTLLAIMRAAGLKLSAHRQSATH